jgi:hypothetical protein
VIWEVKNTSAGTSTVFVKYPGLELTTLTASAGLTAPLLPAKSLTTVTFMAGPQQDPFIVTLWGQSTGTTCSVSAIRTSQIP